jgi:glutathione synthase/RimK-type ligase-like ATP-grasp enzyme
MKFDVVLLTADKFLNLPETSIFSTNVILENTIVKEELDKLGLKTKIVSWADKNFDFADAKLTLIRTPWDYFDRFDEFKVWLENVKNKTILINPYEVIKWNMNKHYLTDLKNLGINIPQSIFINQNAKINFKNIFDEFKSEEIVIKPVVSGGARNTFRLDKNNCYKKEDLINELLLNQEFIVQPFIKSITNFGEISIMLINGKYTHSIIKKAKKGDYRVQDIYGGTIELYKPNQDEINFAIKAHNAYSPKPIYTRVDIIIDNMGKLAIAELELIEPQFWYRLNQDAVTLLANTIKNQLKELTS